MQPASARMEMTLQDLGNLGEFVGALVLIASLGYVALQIRQNTRTLSLISGFAAVTPVNTWASMSSGRTVLKAPRTLATGVRTGLTR